MLRIPTNEAAPLSAEIQCVLALLSEVESCYESDREYLKGWSGPEAVKVRLIGHLEAHYAQEREPLVQRLADLHRQITTASMFQSLCRPKH